MFLFVIYFLLFAWSLESSTIPPLSYQVLTNSSASYVDGASSSFLKYIINSTSTFWTAIKFGIIGITSTQPKVAYQKLHYEPKKVRLSYINGINYSEDECKGICKQIEAIFRIKVHHVYLPSTGSWAKDLTTAAYTLYARPSNYALVDKLTIHLRRLLKEVGPNGRVLHIAHSAGAIITYLSAKYQLTYDERKHIDVICFGGGRSITKKYFPGRRLINYYSQNDPLTLVDVRAGKLIRTGQAMVGDIYRRLLPAHLAAAPVPSASSHPSLSVAEPSTTAPREYIETDRNNTSAAPSLWPSLSLTTKRQSSAAIARPTLSSPARPSLPSHAAPLRLDRIEVLERKHNTSFVFLKAVANHALKDHNIDGPTYLRILEHEAALLHTWLAEVYADELVNASAVRYIRKRLSSWTGQHHVASRLWSTLRGSHLRRLPASPSETSSGDSLWAYSVSVARHVRKRWANMTGMHHFFSAKARAEVV